MNEFEIDFECEVAAKHDIRPATAEEVDEYRARNSRQLRQIPESEWPLFVGRITPSGKIKNHRPKAETMERAVGVLVGALGNERKVPFYTVALKVVRALGTHMGEGGETVSHWYAIAGQLQLMFQGKDFIYPDGFSGPRKEVRWPHIATQLVGEVGIFLVPNKDGERVLALRPVDLVSALTLYGARMLATGTTFDMCEFCNTPFLRGGAGRTNKKRGDSRFCSDKCRYRYHNEANRKLRG
jgi:hypothetical protein